MDAPGPKFPIRPDSGELEPYQPRFQFSPSEEPKPPRRFRWVHLVALAPPLLVGIMVWISLPTKSRPALNLPIPQTLIHWDRHQDLKPKTDAPIRIGYIPVKKHKKPPFKARHAAPLEIPIPAELATQGWSNVPGAMPGYFRYQYNDSYRGWPVKPLHSPAVVRGSFLAPRSLNGAYHFGIDISVNDAHPDPVAPKGASARVYAVESGVVAKAYDGMFQAGGCVNRRLSVGHFEYWHVMTTLPLGSYVRAGQQVGWSCLGEYHVHLSEWQRLNEHLIWVNPLHKGGKLTPYRDKASPLVESLNFFGPTPKKWCPKKSLRETDAAQILSPDNLSGDVELRSHINDFRTISGFLSAYPKAQGGFTPYRVAVAVRDSSGNVVFAHDTFRADQILRTPYLVSYAPGSAQPLPFKDCLMGETYCGGSFIYRPFSRFTQAYWNTASIATPNGTYAVTVYAWDIMGNVSEKSQEVTVNNPSSNSDPVLTQSKTPACWQTTGHRQYVAAHKDD